MKGYKNLNQLVTLEEAKNKDGRYLMPSDLSVIDNGAIVYDEESILWVGPSSDIPSEYQEISFQDGRGYVLTPEIVDSHTHLVFAGNRSREYAMRMNGADYEEIARQGGGILATSNPTNNISLEEMFQQSCEKIERITSYGVGTIEIKSGYALNIKREKEVSLLIDKLKKHFYPRVQILNTFMAAHAVPKNFSSSKEYLSKVCIPLLEELAEMNVIDFVDIFHEDGYFTEQDLRELAKYAKNKNLKLKTHSDEFNDNKGALIACELGATSCDHLLCTGDDGIEALAKSSTVATLLPGTGFFLGKPQANARKMLDAGVKLALASDYNPGSCHCDNLLLIASIAAPSLGLNQAQLWSAITLNASAALGLSRQGALIKGMKPRMSIFEAETLDEITYNWGRNLLKS